MVPGFRSGRRRLPRMPEFVEKKEKNYENMKRKVNTK